MNIHASLIQATLLQFSNVWVDICKALQDVTYSCEPWPSFRCIVILVNVSHRKCKYFGFKK